MGDQTLDVSDGSCNAIEDKESPCDAKIEDTKENQVSMAEFVIVVGKVYYPNLKSLLSHSFRNSVCSTP